MQRFLKKAGGVSRLFLLEKSRDIPVQPASLFTKTRDNVYAEATGKLVVIAVDSYLYRQRLLNELVQKGMIKKQGREAIK